MPYIQQSDRDDLRPAANVPAMNAGELTFQITSLLAAYAEHNGHSYRTYAEMLGSMEGAKLDLAHRRINDYEDAKRAANGDVW